MNKAYLVFWIFVSVVLGNPSIVDQSKSLLNQLRDIHPTFKQIIHDTERGNYDGHKLLHRRDPYTQIRFLVKQGCLLCEVLRVLAMIVLTEESEKVEMSKLECHFPSAISDPASESGQQFCALNHEMSRYIYEKIYQEPMPISLDATDILVIYDVVTILEQCVGRLAILLPLYPVMLFRLDETSSLSSSLESLPLPSQDHHSYDELLETEQAYIHKLNVMYEYVLQTGLTAPALTDQVQRWFPNIKEIRDFHLAFHASLSIHRNHVAKLAAAFFQFNEIIGCYIAWIECLQTDPTNMAIIATPEMNQVLTLDSTPGGVHAYRIQPMQRLLRYPLLIKSLMTGAEETNVKYLEAAHSIVSVLSQRVNELIRVIEMNKVKASLLHLLAQQPEMTNLRRFLGTQDLYQETLGSLRILIDKTGEKPKQLEIQHQPVVFYFFKHGVLILADQRKRTSVDSYFKHKSLTHKLSDSIKRSLSISWPHRPRSSSQSAVHPRYLIYSDLTHISKISAKEFRIETSRDGWEDFILQTSDEMVLGIYEMIQRIVRPIEKRFLLEKFVTVKLKFQEEISWLLWEPQPTFERWDEEIQSHFNEIYTPHKLQYYLSYIQGAEQTYARIKTDEDIRTMLAQRPADEEYKILVR